MSTLSVLVDGAKMPDDEARAFWQRFSDWMEEHKGDLAGFAAQEGFASVHPGVDGGRPVLRASRTAAQGPYVPVRGDEGRGPGSRAPGGGSGARHGGRPAEARGGPKPGKTEKKGPRGR